MQKRWFDSTRGRVTKEQCPIHHTDKEICGGHVEVFTEYGWEVLGLTEDPAGSPITPTAEEELRRPSILLSQANPDDSGLSAGVVVPDFGGDLDGV